MIIRCTYLYLFTDKEPNEATAMGVGRRMHKQGPPLDLGKVSAQKKRKASEFDDSAREKKRRPSGGIKAPAPGKKQLNGTANSGLKHSTKGNFANDKSTQAQKGKKMAKKPEPVMSDALLDESSDDDAADLLGGV